MLFAIFHKFQLAFHQIVPVSKVAFDVAFSNKHGQIFANTFNNFLVYQLTFFVNYKLQQDSTLNIIMDGGLWIFFVLQKQQVL